MLFAPFISNAQDSTSKKSRLSIGANFSPNYSYRTLKSPSSSQWIVDLREKTEQAAFGFNTGLSIQYLLTKRLEIELGIQFSQQTHAFKDIEIFDINGGPSLGTADNRYIYQYLEIPLRVNYRIVNKKFFSYITAGISLNLLLNDKTKAWARFNNGDTKFSNTKTSIRDFNKTIIGLIGGVGAGYHINKKLSLRLEPLFRYSLIPLAEAPIEQYNYSIGCQVGVNLKL